MPNQWGFLDGLEVHLFTHLTIKRALEKASGLEYGPDTRQLFIRGISQVIHRLQEHYFAWLREQATLEMHAIVQDIVATQWDIEQPDLDELLPVG